MHQTIHLSIAQHGILSLLDKEMNRRYGVISASSIMRCSKRITCSTETRIFYFALKNLVL